jgi:hypothetical protein
MIDTGKTQDGTGGTDGKQQHQQDLEQAQEVSIKDHYKVISISVG